jgi:hypothetical protein
LVRITLRGENRLPLPALGNSDNQLLRSDSRYRTRLLTFTY